MMALRSGDRITGDESGAEDVDSERPGECGIDLVGCDHVEHRPIMAGRLVVHASRS